MDSLTADTLAGLLGGPRARGAFLLRSVLDPPWSLRVEDRAPLCLVTMIHGNAWIVPDAGSVTQLRPGEVAILRGPDPYTMADDPGREPDVIIGPGQECTTLRGPRCGVQTGSRREPAGIPHRRRPCLRHAPF